MFADADPVITRALAHYIAENDADASRVLGDFIDANSDHVRGRSRLTFGRSDAAHSSLQRFKAAWGAEELPLRYAVAGGAAPATAGPGPLDAVLRQVIRRSPPFGCRALGRALYRYAA